MKKGSTKNRIEIWGGIECSLNRVEDRYMNQLDLSGHYKRGYDDIKSFADLGIKALRYPVLWEKHSPEKDKIIDWEYSSERLAQIKQAGITPIAGLVHHGSGPVYADFFDGSFAKGLADYAEQVAANFPWIEYYTPVNEPLTTARFCGMYGHWYPHKKTPFDFLTILFEECRGTVLAMQAIRKINPYAKLIQTEDLSKTHSTPKLKYQAEFENNRRWLSFDLLCGKVDENHPLWSYLIWVGLKKEDLLFFVNNTCPPDIMGINHYVTSERWLDERIEKFPSHYVGGNGREVYADVEAVRVGKNQGPQALFKEVWERYNIPIAITEVHLHCSREEQLRWFYQIWKAVNNLQKKGTDVRAITAWALLGSYDWCTLLTKPMGKYEPGPFDVRSIEPRPTALTKLIRLLATNNSYSHPVLHEEGWWNRPIAVMYNLSNKKTVLHKKKKKDAKPLIIIGKTGTLGKALCRICGYRAIHYINLGRDDVNIADITDIKRMIDLYKPWAIINTAGYVRVDDAEKEAENCFHINSMAPECLSMVCRNYGIQFVTYSSDLVFNGKKNNPYLESDAVSPLSIYGKSKVMAEESVLHNNTDALIIRTSAFFGPWDQYNFVHHALKSLKNQEIFSAPKDVIISPTYVPDLAHTSLDLLIDEASGICNVSNKGRISWAELVSEIAQRSGYDPKPFKSVNLSEMNFAALRPVYSVLDTEKGYELPTLDHALGIFFREQECLKM